ncbi:MAG: NusG domain II-containing protein [Spirochaetales bacterium]|nr:NusG domain II-containing protein [Spirochaetales bacterium]
MKDLRILDILIIIVGIVFVILTATWTLSGREGQAFAEVTSLGEVYLYPLSQDGSWEFYGPSGRMVVEVKDEAARVAYSECPEHICESAGWLTQPPAWTACLPNRLILRIVAAQESEDDVDATVF